MESKVTWSYKLRLLALFCLAYTIFYIYPNFWSESSARELPLLPLDLATPLLPWTFPIYLSLYVLEAIIIIQMRDFDDLESFARMAFATLFVCGAFFMFFPTTYPRPEYPASDWWLVQWAMDTIAAGDTPRNCFPSMHVAITGVAVWAMRKHHLKQMPLLVLWALAIYVSTLTTKQHYFVDILGGLGVVLVVAYLELKIFCKLAQPKWMVVLLRR